MAKVNLIHNSDVTEPCTIFRFLHCEKCLKEMPRGEKPATWARLNVGMTPKGIQIWCERHSCSVDHVMFTLERVPGLRITDD